MMFEWHDYAAGPNKKLLRSGKPNQHYWKWQSGTAQESILRDAIEKAKRFYAEHGLLSCFGAWMPRDKKKGSLNEREVISFPQFSVAELRNENIPWSLKTTLVLKRMFSNTPGV